MRSRLASGALICVLLPLGAACKGAPTAPPSPSPSQSTFGPLTLNVPSILLHDESPVQATASVSLGDGTRVDVKDVKCRPDWLSSAESIVRVDTDGRIHPTGLGEATVTVTCGYLSAHAVVRVRQAFRVAGMIVEKYDTARGVPNATVTVTSGESVGLSAVTEATGKFVLSRLLEPSFNVSVTSPYGEPQTADVAEGQADLRIQIAPQLKERTLSIEASESGSGPGTFFFETHHKGPITVSLKSECLVIPGSFTFTLQNRVMGTGRAPLVWSGLGNNDYGPTVEEMTSTAMVAPGLYRQEVAGRAHCRWRASMRYPG